MKLGLKGILLTLFLWSYTHAIFSMPPAQPMQQSGQSSTQQPMQQPVQQPIQPPKQQPMQQPVQRPVPVMPAPAVPVQSIQQAVPQQSVSAVERFYQQDLDQLHKGMSTIDRLSDTLDVQVEEVVKKIENAQEAIAEAKKMSFDILKEPSENKARELYEKINEKIRAVKEAQELIQGSLNQKFLETVTASKVEMTKVEGMAARIRAKIMQFQGVQPTAGLGASGKQISGVTSATSSPEQTKKTEEPSVTASFLNLLSTIAAKAIKFGKAMKAAVIGSQQNNEAVKKKPEMVVESKKFSDETLSQGRQYSFFSGLCAMVPLNQPRQQIPVAPVSVLPMQQSQFAQPIPVQQPRTLQEFKNAAQGFLQFLDMPVKQLDQTRIFFTQQYQSTKDIEKRLNNLIDTMPVVKNYLELQRIEQEARKPPYWKTFVLQMVDKSIDLGINVGRFSMRLMRGIYRYFFAGIVHTFKHDVQKKLEKIEQDERKQATEEKGAL